jgi:hypothetical protein
MSKRVSLIGDVPESNSPPEAASILCTLTVLLVQSQFVVCRFLVAGGGGGGGGGRDKRRELGLKRD